MAYTLEEFCADTRKALKENPNRAGRDKVRALLERLLDNKDFVAAHCGPDAREGIHTLYHDKETDFYVLAHINTKARKSPPHDHGASWAVYGQAVGHTDMTMWDRLDDGKTPGKAQIREGRKFRLTPGTAGLFDVNEIHQIEFTENARFVRITGTDLATIPTYRYDDKAGTVSVADRSGQHAGAGAVGVR